MQMEQLEDVIITQNSGMGYIDVLRNIHTWLKPANYLEIGVNRGLTLALANCDTIAVDPKFLISDNVILDKKLCLFFQLTSDDFFLRYKANEIFRSPLQLAFLDGLHEYECLLRDVFNAEKSMSKNSVMMLHDCVPTDIYMSRRGQFDEEIRKKTKTPSAWTGDVWKTILILKKYRPDLEIHAFNARPTGLVFITNLNPDWNCSTILYDSMIKEFETFDLEFYGLHRYLSELRVKSTSDIDSAAKMLKLFDFHRPHYRRL